jgi:C4-dicarboxylate transporter DctQ subunit/C4-dicarboxylate transporter DctM subunit
MKRIGRALIWFERNFEEVFVFATLVAMTILIFGQTVSRFTIRQTPAWTQELAQFIQVYFVYLGACYAIKKDVHIRITVLGRVFPPLLYKIFDLLGYVFFLLFCVILIAWGFPLCNQIRQFHQVSASLQLPMFIPYLAVPLGGVIMSYRLIQQIVLVIRSESRSPKSGPDAHA